MHMTDEALDALQWHKFEAGHRRWGPWTRGHLENGFYGVRCLELYGQEALQVDDLIRLWGHTVFEMD
eukprot:5947390-Alexandrium_andersonii.AAC.1